MVYAISIRLPLPCYKKSFFAELSLFLVTLLGKLIGELISVTERLNSKYTEIRDASCYGLYSGTLLLALISFYLQTLVSILIILIVRITKKTLCYSIRFSKCNYCVGISKSGLDKNIRS